MPIVVSRATGEIISKPELTQADRDLGWAAVARAFAKRHPELFLPEQPDPLVGQHKENAAAQKQEVPMTYREQFHEEHPDKDADLAHIYGCPHYPGTGLLVECVPLYESCRDCWDREMEVTEDANKALPR